jgi:hypothetical protein
MTFYGVLSFRSFSLCKFVSPLEVKEYEGIHNLPGIYHDIFASARQWHLANSIGQSRQRGKVQQSAETMSTFG